MVTCQNKAIKVKQRDDALRKRQLDFEVSIPTGDFDEVRRKRLIYRSKQRGWLEVDLLLGSWAAINVPHLTTKEMDEYDQLLEEETIDIYNYVSGKDPLPPHLLGLSIIKKIQEYAFASKINSPIEYATMKAKANLT